MASSSAVKSRPPKPPGGEWVEYDEFIDRQIRKTRGQVKGVEIASALMTLAAGALAFFLVVAVFDHWVLTHGLGFWGRLLCLAMFLGGAGYYAADKLLPWLIYRINPIYAAQAIEKSRPTLKNSLINFLFLRGQTARMSPAVYKAVEEQAAAGLSRVTVESAVDRSRLIHIGYALLVVVGLFATYLVVSPKNPWNTIGRVMMPWSDIPPSTRVEIIDAQPGTQTVFRGATVEVSAEIRGLKQDEPVRVVYSTADHEAVDQPVTMFQPSDRFRHSAKIPPAAADQAAAGQQKPNADSSEGVQQDIDYRIEAGDAVSPTYHLTAITAPTIAIDSVDYQFPDYTGLMPRFAQRHRRYPSPRRDAGRHPRPGESDDQIGGSGIGRSRRSQEVADANKRRRPDGDRQFHARSGRARPHVAAVCALSAAARGTRRARAGAISDRRDSRFGAGSEIHPARER